MSAFFYFLKKFFDIVDIKIAIEKTFNFLKRIIMLLFFPILLALTHSISICSNAQTTQKKKNLAAHRIGIAAQTVDSASTISAYLAVIKTKHEKAVDSISTSLAPSLQGKPSTEFTAQEALQLSETLKRWAFQNAAVKEAHLAENPDSHWAQLSDNSLYRYSGYGRFAFDREPIVQRKLDYIAKSAEFRFVRNEEGLVQAIRRLNLNEIAAQQAEAYRARCETDKLEKENAELQKELAQLEGTDYGF
jgi:hypothetical protein